CHELRRGLVWSKGYIHSSIGDGFESLANFPGLDRSFGIDRANLVADDKIILRRRDLAHEAFILCFESLQLLAQSGPAHFWDQKPQFGVIATVPEGIAGLPLNMCTLLSVTRREQSLAPQVQILVQRCIELL